MSLDGRPHTIPVNLHGDARVKYGTCEHGGSYARLGAFTRCTEGRIHCTKCGKTARRFGKVWTCGCK